MFSFWPVTFNVVFCYGFLSYRFVLLFNRCAVRQPYCGVETARDVLYTVFNGVSRYCNVIALHSTTTTTTTTSTTTNTAIGTTMHTRHTILTHYYNPAALYFAKGFSLRKISFFSMRSSTPTPPSMSLFSCARRIR